MSGLDIAAFRASMVEEFNAQHLAANQRVAQEFQVQREQIEQLQLAAQGRQPGHHAAQAPQLPSLKIPPPRGYSGNPSESLDDWIGAMQQQATFYHPQLEGARGMTFISTFLHASALDWYRDLHPQPADWPALQVALRKRFQPINSEEIARARLHTLTQGNMPISEFLSAFRKLMQKLPNMHESDRLFHFFRALKPSITAQIQMHGVTALDVAADMAVRIGSSHHAASHHSASAGGGGHHYGAQAMDLNHMDADSRATSSHSSSTLDTFDEEMLHAIRAHGTSKNHAKRTGVKFISHLTPAQTIEYRAAGKCFGCGSKEHMSPKCPRRVVDEKSGVVSWPNPRSN